MRNLIVIAVALAASFSQAAEYKTVKNNSIPSKYKQVVEFKENWTWSNKIKKWKHKDGRQLTALRLLSQKEIKLVPVESAKKKGPFITFGTSKAKQLELSAQVLELSTKE